MRGYHRNVEETNRTFTSDGWLKTGDLGYMSDGELYIVGRSKDVVKKAGAKYDAADVQAVVGGVAGVRAGCVAAFSVESAVRGTEELVVLAETREENAELRRHIAVAITRAVLGTFGTGVDILRLLSPGVLLKTSSGKVRTDACRSEFLVSGFAAEGDSLRD
jgi:acyl-CoA synthetase (AMP-forming)/AMP-acid ligase II